MNHDGKPVCLTELVDPHHPGIGRMNVLIDRTELDTAQFEPHDFIKRFVNRIDDGVNCAEPNDFFRMACGIRSNVFIRNPQPRMMCSQAEYDYLIDTCHRLQVLFRWNVKIQFMPTDRKSTRLNSSHLGISYA